MCPMQINANAMQLFNVEPVMLEQVKHIDKWHNNDVTILKIKI